MPPLETVNRAEISLLPVPQPDGIQELPRAVQIPDVHVLVPQLVRVRAASDEPQQLLDDAPPEHALRGQKREDVVAHGVPHLRPEDAVGAHAGAVAALRALLQDVPDVVQILVLFVPLLLLQQLRRGVADLAAGRLDEFLVLEAVDVLPAVD